MKTIATNYKHLLQQSSYQKQGDHDKLAPNLDKPTIQYFKREATKQMYNQSLKKGSTGKAKKNKEQTMSTTLPSKLKGNSISQCQSNIIEKNSNQSVSTHISFSNNKKRKRSKQMLRQSLKESQSKLEEDINAGFSSNEAPIADEVNYQPNKGYSPHSIRFSRSPMNINSLNMQIIDKGPVLEQKDSSTKMEILRAQTHLWGKLSQSPQHAFQKQQRSGMLKSTNDLIENFEQLSSHTQIKEETNCLTTENNEGPKPLEERLWQKLRSQNGDLQDLNYFSSREASEQMNLPRETLIKKSPLLMNIKESQDLEKDNKEKIKTIPRPIEKPASCCYSQLDCNVQEPKQPYQQKKNTSKSPQGLRISSPRMTTVHKRLYTHSKKWNQLRQDWQPPDFDHNEAKISCTFRPTLSKSPMMGARKDESISPIGTKKTKRSFKMFMADQKKHQKQKEKKMQSLKEMVVESYSVLSSKRSKSNDSHHQVRGNDFYERTMQMETQKQERLKNLRDQHDFERAGLKLQRSGEREIEKEIVERLCQPKSSFKQPEPTLSYSPQINAKSLFYLSRGIQSDFEKALKATDCFESFIRQEKYEQIMEQMGYCGKAGGSGETAKKVRGIWNLLCNGQKYIYIQNLKVVIFALEGCCFPWMVRQPSQCLQEKRVGVFKGTEFYLKDSDEAKSLCSQFLCLSTNRKSLLRETRSLEKNHSASKTEQKGKEEKTSARHRLKFSKSQLQSRDEKVEEALMKKGEAYLKKVQERKAEKEQSEIEKCTFKPRIKTSFQSQKGAVSFVSHSGKATPKLSMHSTAQEHKGRSTLEIEYEQQKQECSFNPKISARSKELAIQTERRESGSRKREKKIGELEHSNKATPRIQVGKSPREMAPKILPGAQVLSSKNDKSRNQYQNHRSESHQSPKGELDYKRNQFSQKDSSRSAQNLKDSEEEKKAPNRRQEGSMDSAFSNEIQKFAQKPAIYLDVNLGGGRFEPLFIKEEESVEEIVENFAEAFGLNNKKKEKLFKVIYYQLRGYLPSILEED